ncbi:hypothetical protein PM082_005239 [Marasmius tenuissimus]|nr:hypothetical protein PM082_005239 [Marasmius tenuissimus]
MNHNAGSRSDPICIDSESEDYISRPTSISLPRRWHRRFSHEEGSQVSSDELIVTIRLERLEEGKALEYPNSVLLRGLPAGLTSREVSELFAKHGLSRIIESVFLYPTDCCAVLRLYQRESVDYARQVLEDIRYPFPERSMTSLLTVEDSRRLALHAEPQHDIGSLDSPPPVQLVPSTIDWEQPVVSAQANPYGPLDEIYEALDGGISSEAESTLSDANYALAPALPTPVPRADASLAPRRPVTAYIASDPEESGSENTPSSSASLRSRKRPQQLDQGGAKQNNDKRVRVPPSRAPEGHNQPVEPSLAQTALRVPKVQHGRARRVLAPTSPGLPMVTVSMRADFQFFDIQRRVRLSSKSMPASLLEDTLHVEDATIVDDTVVVGYDKGPYQVTLLDLGSGAQANVKRSELSHKPHATDSTSKINASGRAISCLAPDLSGGSFVSGGYDRTIYRWSLDGGRPRKITTVNAAPSSIACRQEELLVGVGKVIEVYDIEHIHAHPQRYKLSNGISHIHIHPSARSISVVEVDHLDQQILLFDCRKRQYNRPADCALGHRSSKWSRYYRGSVLHSYFVRGYSDHTICLWDFRNPKSPVAKKRREVKAVHTAFTDAGIVAFGGDTVTFLDFNLDVL